MEQESRRLIALKESQRRPISMRRVEIEEAFEVKAIGAGEPDVEGNIERDKVAFLHELGRSVLHSDLIGRRNAVEVRAQFWFGSLSPDLDVYQVWTILLDFRRFGGTAVEKGPDVSFPTLSGPFFTSPQRR